jgi:hypothetical protein
MTDYRAELQRLVKAYDEHHGIGRHHDRALFRAVKAARTALAQPEPEGVGELVEDLRECADSCTLAEKHGWARVMRRTAELLTRYARPTIKPVPVAERLPGPEDCDAEERCWWFTPADFSDDVSVPSWHLDASPGPGQFRFYGYTHSLPHHALPVPGAEVG